MWYSVTYIFAPTGTRAVVVDIQIHNFNATVAIVQQGLTNMKYKSNGNDKITCESKN